MNNNHVITVTAMYTPPGSERHVLPLSSILYALPSFEEKEGTIILLINGNKLYVKEDIHAIEGFMRGDIDK